MLCGSWRGMCKKEEVGGRKRKKEKGKEKEGSCETHDDGREGIRDPIPEHDKNVRYVVHTTLMHVLQFFVCRGHELQPGCYQ